MRLFGAGSAWVAIFGGVIIHLTLGSLFTWGNMNTYVVSYVRAAGGSARIVDAPFILMAVACGQTITMPIGGLIEKRIGPQLTAAIGCAIMSSSVYLSSTVLDKWYTFALFYGLFNGMGVGLTYTAPVTCAARWLPQKKGLAAGIITAGFGAGAVILNQIQTSLINPENRSADVIPFPEHPNERYFGDPELLERVPLVIRRLAILYMAAQLVGISLLSDPKSSGSATTENITLPKPAASATIQRALRTDRFWHLYACLFFNGLAVTFVATFWKGYGYNYQDKTLSIVGSLASLHNAMGRIYWGKRADRHGVADSVIVMCSAWWVLLMTFPYFSTLGVYSYTACLCGIFFCLGGTFSLFPTATTVAFGSDNFGAIYGILYSSQMVSSTCVALSAPFLTRLGAANLSWIFASCVGATAATTRILRSRGKSFDQALKLM